MTAVFLATRNRGKLAELQRILAGQVPGIRVLGADDVPAYPEPVEDQPTFAGNALVKARAALAATGLPSLADDSGLCVDALNGMPGVLSARWAGVTGAGGRARADDRNNQLLLEQLAQVPDERRGAHFTCVIAFCAAGPQGPVEHVVEGRMRGRVIRERRGTGGFGYDVVFVPDEYAGAGLTSAELTAEEKDRISHRGHALRQVAPLVAAALTPGARGSDARRSPDPSSW